MVQAVVFDAYGTLLDVHAAMERYADRLGPEWQAISADWRGKQIEYTWVRSLAGAHRDFWRLTEEALAWVAARHHITDAALLADVLLAYRHLSAYPEVTDVLRRLGEQGMRRAILSNGDPDMLGDALHTAGLDAHLDAVLSVESVRVYKPDPRVYELPGAQFGLAASQMAFVTSNPWDAFGAARFGYRVFWINRAGVPAEYDLHSTATVLNDLAALPDALAGVPG